MPTSPARDAGTEAIYPSTKRCALTQVIEYATERGASALQMKFLADSMERHRDGGRCAFTDHDQATDEDAHEKSRATESSPERSRASSPVA